MTKYLNPSSISINQIIVDWSCICKRRGENPYHFLLHYSFARGMCEFVLGMFKFWWMMPKTAFVDSRLEKEAKLLPTQSLGFSTSMFDVDFAEGKYSKGFLGSSNFQL